MSSEFRSESSLLVPDSAPMYVAITFAGVGNGLLAGWLALTVEATFAGLHAAVWLFLVVWAGTTAYFSYRRAPSGVLGAGLYVAAVLLLLKPVAVYVPALAASTEPRTVAAAAGDLFVWGAFAAVVALGAAGLGRFLAGRAARKHARRATRPFRRRDR